MEIIPRRCTPELEYLLARFSSLFPYRQVVQLLREFFPVSPKLNHATVRNRTLRVAQRMENDDDWTKEVPAKAVSVPLADPGASAGVLLGIDTGFVRACARSGPRHFEVTVGRCERPGGPSESFGFVVDEAADPVAKARWQALLARQGHRPGGGVPDGALMGRRPSSAWLEPLGAKHVMDWFHVAMRFERLQQIVRGLRRSHPLEADACQEGITRANMTPRFLPLSRVSAPWRVL